jgi:hypothetical protein
MNSGSAPLDFFAYIAEYTEGFAGRERVFDEINGWLAAGYDAGRVWIIEPPSEKGLAV